MTKSVFAIKISQETLDELKDFCEEMGYKQSSFVEKAIKVQMGMEELKEDIFDLISLKSQEKLARPLKEYHRQRK